MFSRLMENEIRMKQNRFIHVNTKNLNTKNLNTIKGLLDMLGSKKASKK